MSEPKIIIDARGLKCPRPIIELAKARKTNPAGTTVRIMANDLAFENDVQAWCDATGNLILSITKQGQDTVADIEFI